MMRSAWLALAGVLLAWQASAAEVKLSSFGTITPVLTDYAVCIDDPGGTPANANCTLQSLMDLFEANLELATQRADLDFQSTYDINNAVNIDLEGYADFAEIAEPAAPGANTMRLWAETDSGKSMFKYQNADGVIRELGRDLVHIVRNTTGAQIDKGDAVYISGANGSLPTIALADADNPSAMPAFGLALEDIGINSNGFVLVAGDLGGLDTSAFNQGDILYVSTTPGALTATEPTGTTVDQQVGVVISANGGSGIISVNVQGENDPALTSTFTNKTIDADDNTLRDFPAEIFLTASDETTDLTTGTAKRTFRMPHAMTLTAVRASLTTAATGADFIVDVNEGGATVLSTKVTIDAGETTSETAATEEVVSDSALADDAEITIDIDQIGSGTAGAGLKVWLIGTRDF